MPATVNQPLAIIPFLCKLLDHHLACEVEQRDELERRRAEYLRSQEVPDAKGVGIAENLESPGSPPTPPDSQTAVSEKWCEEYQAKRLELESTVRDTEVYKARVAQLAQTAGPQFAEMAAPDWARQMVELQLLAWNDQTCEEEGLMSAPPPTPWQTAVELLIGKYGLGSGLAVQGELCDGESDTPLREFLARWRLACAGPKLVGDEDGREERTQFGGLRPGDPIQAWADDLDRSGRTATFVAELVQHYPDLGREVGMPSLTTTGVPSAHWDEPVTPAEPKVYLTSWREILDALGLKPDQRGKVAKLNKDFDGPIVIAKQGSQPTVERGKLLAWWNGLEDRLQELQQRRRDAQATISDQHPYGEDGTIVPEISGSVERRRRDHGRGRGHPETS